MGSKANYIELLKTVNLFNTRQGKSSSKKEVKSRIVIS